MYTKREILRKIYETILEEHGDIVKVNELLISCNIDSFGYAIFWTTLEDTFDFKIPKDDTKKVDYSTLTVKDVVNYVYEVSNVSA